MGRKYATWTHGTSEVVCSIYLHSRRNIWQAAMIFYDNAFDAAVVLLILFVLLIVGAVDVPEIHRGLWPHGV